MKNLQPSHSVTGTQKVLFTAIFTIHHVLFCIPVTHKFPVDRVNFPRKIMENKTTDKANSFRGKVSASMFPSRISGEFRDGFCLFDALEH
jgi:hypothetical protein